MNVDKIVESYSLENKVAIVTGASKENGMGIEIARKLGELGARIVICDLRERRRDLEVCERMPTGSQADLDEAVKSLSGEGIEVTAVACDVTDPVQIENVVAAAVSTYGGVDILVNNAGIFQGCGTVMDVPDNEWHNTWQVHVLGILNFCKTVVHEMKKRGGGVIVNNSSVAGLVGTDSFAAYGVTKGAIVSLTQNLAAELGPQNIRVNAFCPGNVYTNISDGEREYLANVYGVPEDVIEAQMVDPVALGRRCTAREAAEVAGFLASPASSYLTGLALPVSGGIQAGLV